MAFLGRASAWVVLSLLPLPAGAQTPSTASIGEVTACLERNIPRTTSEQIVEFVAVDRIGGERVSRAKILGKRFDDGLRRLLLRFTKPLDMRGSSFLVMETATGANDMFLYTPELRKVKRVTAQGAGGTMFGTDFSYEDFERWQLLNKPGKQKRNEDSTVADRAVYVVESLPDAESGSAYETVVTYIDKETCVVIKSESYETGHQLRKVLTASPETVIEDGGIYVASEVMMQDVRDETHTNVVVEDLAVDREIGDEEFAISRLSRRR